MDDAIAYSFAAMPFAVAILVAMVICLFLVSGYRSPTTGLVATGALCWFDILFPNAGPLQLGLYIYVPDIVTGLLGLVALLRALFSRNRPSILPVWYAFLAAVALSFALGLGSFGTAAGTSLRPYFYAVSVASYFMTFPVDEARVRTLFTGLSWIALGVVGVVYARWLIVALPIDALLPPSGSFDVAGMSKLRTINSHEAAVLAQVFVLGLFYPQISGLLRHVRLLVPIFALAVIGLQHRSVWVAVMAGVGTRFALPAAGRRGATQLLMLALVLLVLVVPIALSGRLGGVTQDITQSASRAVALADTAQVRLEGWKFAIDKWRNGGPVAWAIGLPLGTSMDRYQVTSSSAVLINVQAHNYYVQTLFNFGLLGLGVNVLVYAWVMRQLYRMASRPDEGSVAPALLLLLTMQLAFYLTYGVAYMQGLLLGMSVAYAMTSLARVQPVAGRAGKASGTAMKVGPSFRHGMQ